MYWCLIPYMFMDQKSSSQCENKLKGNCMLHPQRSVGVALGSWTTWCWSAKDGGIPGKEDRHRPGVFLAVSRNRAYRGNRGVSTLQVVAVVSISVLLHVTTHGRLNPSTARHRMDRSQGSRSDVTRSSLSTATLLHGGDGSGSCTSHCKKTGGESHYVRWFLKS